ncbi:MAG: hypothetical protein R6V52_07075 [Bacteroidales bacterium]
MNYKTNDLRGYVLVEKGQYDKFEMWEVELKQRSYTDSVHYEDSVVYRKRVLGQNYTKIPERFLNEEHFYILSVMGRDENGDVIATEEEEWGTRPIGGSSYHHDYYSYNCNGVNYAYRISSHRRIINNSITQSGYLSLEPYAADGSSKFVYFSWDDFASIAQNNPYPFNDYYGVCFQDIYNYGPDGTYSIIQEGVTSADELYGPDGFIVIGSGPEQSVVGIKKNMGPWGGHLINTNTIDPVDNGWGLDQAIDIMNIYAADDLEWYEMPELVCHEAEGIDFDDSDASVYADCFESLYEADWIENLEDGGDFDFFDLIEEISDCINGEEDDDWPWPDNITDISIYRLSSESSQIISLDEDDIVDDNGNIIAPDFVLDDGLYSIGFNFEDRSHSYSIMELEEKINNTLDLADFFEISVFPVPIEDEYFFADINGSMSDVITYNLYDDQGKLFYSEKIKFYTDSGDKSFRVKIDPDRDIPEGILVNEFVFSDGSSISIQSLK